MGYNLGLSAHELRDRLHYDPDTGIFRWLKTKRNGLVGKEAGFVDKDGYVLIRIDSVNRRAHRLAFLCMTGRWPANDVDHRNGIGTDNRWSNLREASPSENKANSKIYSSNRLGVKGVCRRGDRYIATIQFNNERTPLGVFPSLEQAKSAYEAAAARLFGEFVRA